MESSHLQVETLARLARLDLTDTERQQAPDQVTKIIDYVSHLQTVEAEIVPIVPSVRPLRADETAPSKVRADILAAAPERENDYWKVKAVF